MESRLSGFIFVLQQASSMMENTVHIGEQVGTSVILSWYQTAIHDRLPGKFAKV